VFEARGPVCRLNVPSLSPSHQKSRPAPPHSHRRFIQSESSVRHWADIFSRPSSRCCPAFKVPLNFLQSFSFCLWKEECHGYQIDDGKSGKEKEHRRVAVFTDNR
jgi:hypothetical protein